MVVDARVRVTRRDTESEPLLKVPDYLVRYNELYRYGETLNLTTDHLLAEMDSAGITHAVMHAEWEFGEPGLYRVLNERVAEIVSRRPERFTGVATVDPRDGLEAVRELRRAAEDLHLKGLNIEPSFLGIAADDPICYPLYAECAERGLPVSIHIGVHFSRATPMELGDPLRLDRIACAFPSLRIVGMHGGWPWVLQAIAVARRHPTVYLEYAGVAPKYFAVSGSGWESALQFGNSVLQNQVMFASDWPIIPFDRYLTEHRTLPWKPEVAKKFFAGNVSKLYGIKLADKEAAAAKSEL